MGVPKKRVDPGEVDLSSRGGHSLSFEELARLQGVELVEDPRDLLGGWPGDVDDGFEEAVSAWRRRDLTFQT